jgi:hypothetical protein
MLLVDDILFFPVRSIMWIFREISEIAQKELDGEAKSITEQLRTSTCNWRPGGSPKRSSMPGKSCCWTGWMPSKAAGRKRTKTEESDEDETEESGEERNRTLTKRNPEMPGG